MLKTCLAAVLGLSNVIVGATRAKDQPLKFSQNGSLHVAVFEDLHFGDGTYINGTHRRTDIIDLCAADIKDENTLKVMRTILKTEQIDFAVINGDLLDRASTFRDNRTAYIDWLLQPLVESNLTWGSTYGNHDHTVNTSAKMILETEQMYDGCRTKQMVFGRESGIGNYWLPVYKSDDEAGQGTPELLIWFFDSRGGFYYKEHKADGSFVEQPSWVDATVATWFQQTSAELVKQYGKVIPSIAFTHIPVNVFEAFGIQIGVDEHLQPGINDTMPMAQQSYGFCANGTYNSKCDYGGQDIPFMQAIASTEGLLALFSAHEHGNTWCYRWDQKIPTMTIEGSGVDLCFGQHTGYGGAGNWTRGARQVSIAPNVDGKLEIETWIRLETGAIVGRVSLNQTFGQDHYPATPNDKTYLLV